MTPTSQLYCHLLTTAVVLLGLSSCTNTTHSPFPEKELSYAQPVTIPLKFSTEKKLNWDTSGNGVIKPFIKPLDMEALPSGVFDSTGFKPLPQKPVDIHFDFNQLPDTTFNLDNIASTPLHFKTSLLPPPQSIKASWPGVHKNNSLALYELGPSQGLPSKFVTSLVKDKNGLLWIGSGEGIYCYNGEYVKTIFPGPFNQAPLGMMEDNIGNIWFADWGRLGMIDPRKGTLSLSSQIGALQNTICKIIKDDNGRLWFARSNFKGIVLVDPASKTFKTIDQTKGMPLLDGYTTDVLEDEDKNIWTTTSPGGVIIISPKKNKIKFLNKSNGLGSDTTATLTKDNNGKIWIARWPGTLDVVDIKNSNLRHYGSGGFINAFPITLSCDDKGRIWMGKTAGLEIIDPETNNLRFVDQTLGLSGNYVSSCTMDNRKRMWVATIAGLNMIDQHAESVNPFNKQVTSLMQDGVGNLWVATQKGVSVINFQKKTIKYLSSSHGLSNDFIQSFTNTNGNIIISTNGGYNIIDPVRKTIERTSKKEGLVYDTVYNAFKDKAGNIWLTGPNNGIDVVNINQKGILHVDANGGLSDNNIQDSKQDANGQIWLATNNDGVDIIDPVNNTVKYLNDQPGLKERSNKVLLIDKRGLIWIGTGKGIYVVDTKKNTLTHITTKEGLTDNKVLSLLEYNGTIAAGTNNKITLITAPTQPGQDWKIAPLQYSEGLSKQTNSWASDAITSKGQYLWGDVELTIINELKPYSDTATTFITGMTVMTKPQYFIEKPILKEKDTLWAGDKYYTKDKTLANTGYAGDNGLTWDSVTGPYNMPVNLTLPYHQNYIQFQFAQAHTGRQDNTDYCYILEGIDKNWSAVTTNPYSENYLNLPPGKYTFLVRSKNLNGKWGQPAVLSFTITPPWYKTWWAYTFYILVAIGFLRAYIVFRSRRLKKENRILEEKVALRTQQLQQSIEDLKETQAQLIQSEKMASLGELTAGIAHEIQNPLNFVNNFSEVSVELADELKNEIKKLPIEEEKKSELESLINDLVQNQEKINYHGKRADTIVKGMLQHSRNSSGIKEPTNINALADEYLRLSYHGLRAKDKSFNATMATDFDESLPLVNVVSQDIGRVILNLITNAFYSVSEKKALYKNQEGQYEPVVSVSTKKLPAAVEIRVKDNGMGVPQKVLDKIFQPFFTTKPVGKGTGLGLSLSYDIIKAHGGELRVETKEGEGAEFIIQLPA
jgi:signal transduction histidine kinase/streptogramin lyase